MNRLYEVSNQGDVMLSFNVPVSVNGYDYAPNEPCLFLEDVLVKFNYHELDSASKAQGNIMSYQQLVPATITLSNVALTTKICDLILSEPSEPISVQHRMRVLGNEDALYVTTDIDTSKPIFIYDAKGNAVKDYGEIAGSIIYGNFDLSQKYTVYYYGLAQQGDQYGLDGSSLPYMNMQIILKGNVDKRTSTTILRFPKVVLNAIPVFLGTYGSVLQVPLVFDVIKDRFGGKPQVVFV